MLVAGHDTTAYQLSMTLIEIVKHPLVLRKLQEELDRALPNRDDNFSADALTELTYLNCVINEGNRLQPVGSQGSVREAPCDVEYEGMTIPKGSTVIVPAYAMHRSSIIRKPDEFIPERWLADDPELETLKSLFYPFSSGKRNCVGQNLAMLELRMFIATLFRRFNFELVSKVSYEFYLVLRPVNANFKITRRD
jgi:benzoate 4-monooxygenase